MSNDVACVKSSLSGNQYWRQAKQGHNLNQIRTIHIGTSNESTTIRGEPSGELFGENQAQVAELMREVILSFQALADTRQDVFRKEGPEQLVMTFGHIVRAGQ